MKNGFAIIGLILLSAIVGCDSINSFKQTCEIVKGNNPFNGVPGYIILRNGIMDAYYGDEQAAKDNFERICAR